MGYYSCTTLLFSNEARKSFYKHIRKLSAEEQEEIRSFVRFADIIKIKNGHFYLYWHYVKWDSGYYFVPFLYNFLQFLKSKDYLFIRFGESVTDTCIIGSYNERKDLVFKCEINISRNILIDEERIY